MYHDLLFFNTAPQPHTADHPTDFSYITDKQPNRTMDIVMGNTPEANIIKGNTPETLYTKKKSPEGAIDTKIGITAVATIFATSVTTTPNRPLEKPTTNDLSICDRNSPAYEFPRSHKYLRKICSGSEGTVGLWRHVSTGHLLAVKSFQHRARYVKDLPKEVLLLKDLPHHENIIRFEAFYSTKDRNRFSNRRDCMIFEYCSGGDLWELLDKTRQDVAPAGMEFFPESLLLSVFSQLSSALAFLHEGTSTSSGTNPLTWKPILHRDIKAENILISNNASDWSTIEIKLADFGLAAVYDENYKDNPINSGTPDYWPPEMRNWQSQKYDKSADVWAIGAVLHELAHGFVPIVDVDLYEKDVRDNHPEDIPIGVDFPDTFYVIMAPRRPLPINLHPNKHMHDPRRLWRCQKYSDRLNDCMMMALEMDKDDRPSATELLSLVRLAADFEHDEQQQLELNYSRYKAPGGS